MAAYFPAPGPRPSDVEYTFGATNAQRQICTYAIEVHRFSLYQMQLEGKDWSQSPLLEFEHQVSNIEDDLALESIQFQAERGKDLNRIARARKKLRRIEKKVQKGKRKYIEAAKDYAGSFPATLQDYVRSGTDDGYLCKYVLNDLIADNILVAADSQTRRRRGKRTLAKGAEGPFPASQGLHQRRPQAYLARLRATTAARDSNRWISKATNFGIDESLKAQKMWKETRDDKARDLEIFRYLANLFGPLESSVFSGTLFPGASYRCLVHSAACTIQLWWKPYPLKLFKMRDNAANCIQMRYRLAVARRRNEAYDRVVRRCLGRMFHRQLASTFHPWKAHVMQKKALKERLRRIFGALKLKCFAAWSELTKKAKEEQKRRFIRACAALLNQKLYATLQAWKTFTVHRKAAVCIQCKARGILAKARMDDMKVIKHQEGVMRKCVATIMHRQLASTFQCWREFWTTRKGLRATLKRITHRSMVAAYDKWKEFWLERKNLRARLKNFFEDLKSVYFRKWKNEVVFRREQRLERLRIAFRRIKHRCMLPAFNAWNLYAYRSVRAKELMKRAFRLNAQDSFRRWHHYTHRKFHKKQRRPVRKMIRAIGWLFGRRKKTGKRARLATIDKNREAMRDNMHRVSRGRQRPSHIAG